MLQEGKVRVKGHLLVVGAEVSCDMGTNTTVIEVSGYSLPQYGKEDSPCHSQARSHPVTESRCQAWPLVTVTLQSHLDVCTQISCKISETCVNENSGPWERL